MIVVRNPFHFCFLVFCVVFLFPTFAKSSVFYMVMNKFENKLTLHSFEDASLLKEYRAITGSAVGDKEREGDLKTPEGIYFIERRVPQKKLFKLHGPAAVELNYPNSVDRIFRRSGDGIWIHGVDNEDRMKKRFDTRGCIALSNKDILDLVGRLTYQDIPIVIHEKNIEDVKIGLTPLNSPTHRRVEEWAAAWSSKNLESYLSFYSSDFYSKGMNFDKWTSYKKRLNQKYQSIKVSIEDLKILRHGKYAVAVFRQKYRGDSYSVIGRKRLYLIGEGANALILAEESIDDSVSN